MFTEIRYEEVPIFDSLHGFIKITSAEKQIINSLYFQRLRDIKQLSFAYYVFPGAVHTRFSHSLGVLATITQILERMKSFEADISSNDFMILRMAALLHDIGHYPLSHLIEQSYKTHQKEFILKIASDDEEGGDEGFLEEQRKKFPHLISEASQHDAHHEQLGAYIIQNTNFPGGITHILKNNQFTDIDIETIALSIQGKSPVTWYNQVLHSELDVDRLDYLTRDSRETGVHYGNFDFDYLVNNCRLIKEDNGNKVFAIKSSAVFTVEHFLLARYFWYAQIISERTISAFDYLGKELFYWIIENNNAYSYLEVLDLVKDPKRFITFNDNYFWDCIYKIYLSENNSTEYSYYKDISRVIVERIPLKRVDIDLKKNLRYTNLECKEKDKCTIKNKCSKTVLCPRIDTIEKIEDQLQVISEKIKKTLKENGKDPRWVIDICKKSSVSKLSSLRTPDENERDPVRIISNGETVFLEELSHSFLKTMNNYELVQPRIYIKEEYMEFIAAIK